MTDNKALDHVFGLARGFMISRAFTTAAKLDLFTTLSHAPEGLTASEIAEKIGLCRNPGFRGTEDFLDCLVSVQALEREGSGPSAVYKNVPSLARYLVRGSEEYIGGILLLNHDRSFWHFGYLEQALRTGQAPDLAVHGITDPVKLFAGDKEATVAFAHGMTGASLGCFKEFAAKFDFTPYKTLGDFGGSLGVLSVCVAQQHPHMRCTSYDLPVIHNAAEQYIHQHGVADRVQVKNHDFFSEEPFPSHDVITMSMILHDWGVEKKLGLMRKAFAALPPGGAFVAIDNVLDEDRRLNTQGFAVSLNMLLEFGEENSCEYTFKEFEGWSQTIGFSSAACIHLQGSKYACIAKK